MKNLVARIIIVGTALASAVAVYAQSKSITADVPFNFYMGSASMPQGAYRVDEIANGEVVSVRTAHASNALVAHDVVGKSENEAPRLVFHRYGDMFFLAEIWTGEPTGLALSKSAREKELAKSGAAPTLAVIRVTMR